MSNDALGQRLDSLEAQLADLAALLLTDDAHQIHQCCQAVQALAMTVAQWSAAMLRFERAMHQTRLQALAQDMAALRVHMARKQAYVEQRLQLLIPAATPAATYGGTKALYAGAGRSSGSLRPLIA